MFLVYKTIGICSLHKNHISKYSLFNLKPFSSVINNDNNNTSSKSYESNSVESSHDDFDLNRLAINTANSKQILKNKIHEAVKRHQVRDGDTGSSAVQIATLTEKIMNLTRHFAMHKKDHHGKRGFEVSYVT